MNVLHNDALRIHSDSYESYSTIYTILTTMSVIINLT